MQKILISIDDDVYKDIKNNKIYTSYRDVPLEACVAIANGIPLRTLNNPLRVAYDIDNAIQYLKASQEFMYDDSKELIITQLEDIYKYLTSKKKEGVKDGR